MIWSLLRIGVVAILAIFAIGFLGSVFARLLERHTQYEYFYEALDAIPDTKAITEWTDNQPKGRTIYDNDRVNISAKVVEAWQGYSTGLKFENKNYLKDHFAATALERGLQVLESGAGETSNMALMGLTIDPLVFHLDGSILQFQADDAIFARYKIDGETLSAYELTEDCILTNMVNEQSGWKIANFERHCAKDMNLHPTLPRDKALPKLKGINYYPKNSPWSFFWTDYNPFIVNPDLDRIEALGVNAIRIFLPYEIFSDKLTSKNALENLEIFLRETQQRGLYIVPTLFDFRGDLSPDTWPADRYYLDLTLPIIAEFDHIAYVDLKNELDIDENYQNPALVEAWARTIIGVSRKIAPELRYTMGWSNAENALRLVDYLDVISYHEYGNIYASKTNYDHVIAGAKGKPVHVTEVGETSFDLALHLPANDQKQSERLQLRLNQFENSDGVFIWTLYDYPVLDPKAVSGSFWHKGIQMNFGLFDEFERTKPAHTTFKNWDINNDK